MLKTILSGGLIALVVIVGCGKNHQQASLTDYTKFVDPFIGTIGSGNTFSGPVTPYGMVQLSAFMRGNKIVGFSHTRLSGSAGGGNYVRGDILATPTIGGDAFDASADHGSMFSHDSEVASPG